MKKNQLAPEEDGTTCLPLRISMTLVQGSQSSKIVADFSYRDGSDLVDHITWSKHPFYALPFYFEGMSHVNNMLSKVEEGGGLDFTYELTLNEYQYPETVYEKLGSAYTKIISYSYLQ